jgi:enoyl-CoA hydratase
MVETEIEGGIARVFLARTEKANALSSPFLAQLLESIGKLASQSELRAVVLAGRGRTFCAGADVTELAQLDAGNAGGFVEAIHRVCQAIRGLPVPVVAKLHGAVIGAGLEIAAACDLRIAAEGTKFSMPEVKLGIPSVVEAALLPRLMGSGRAAWLVLTGEPIDARRAYEWQFLEELCPPEALDARTDALLKALVAADPEALKAQKRLCQLWDEAPLQESTRTSIELFAASYAGGRPNVLLKGLRR